MMKNEKLIIEKLEKIEETTNHIREEIAGMKEHNKNVDLNCLRHEKNIDELYTKSNSNRVAIGKITAMMAVVGSIFGAIGAWILSLFTNK